MSSPAGLAVALVTLAVASAGSVWLKGMARFFSLLLGCVVGMIVAWALGIWHFGRSQPALEVPAVALPTIHLPGITFNAGLIYLAVVAALVNVVDELGVLIGTERLDDADWRRPDFRRMSLGLQASGLFTALSGALGGAALGMSSANLSLAYATGVTSRAVAMAAGAILVAVTFVPLALKHVLSLPDAVVAGILFYAACYFIVSGAELALSRMLSPRRALVIGLSVGAGILLQSVPALTTRFAGTSRRACAGADDLRHHRRHRAEPDHAHRHPPAGEDDASPARCGSQCRRDPRKRWASAGACTARPARAPPPR